MDADSQSNRSDASIASSDDENENENENENESNKQIDSSENKNDDVPIELQKKKKARKLKPFTEADLVSEYGIEQIYRSFPTHTKFRGVGYEGKDLNKLINNYKEWGFRLHPSLAFQDMITRIDTFGSRSAVKVMINELREEEKLRVLNILEGDNEGTS